jgi:hypothetical protein
MRVLHSSCCFCCHEQQQFRACLLHYAMLQRTYTHCLTFMFVTTPFVTASFETVTELGSAQQTGGNPFASPPHNDAAYMAAAAAAAASGSRLPSSSSGGSTPHISGLEALDAAVSRSGGTSSGPSSTKSHRSSRTANRTVKQERTLAQLLAHTG